MHSKHPSERPIGAGRAPSSKRGISQTHTPAEEQQRRALGSWGCQSCWQNCSFGSGETNSPSLAHCLSYKSCDSGTWWHEERAARRVQNKGTDLIFNSISNKGVQGVTGGADTSGISNKRSRGKRKAKSRRLGHSPGKEEELREASLLGWTEPRHHVHRGRNPSPPWGQRWGHPQPLPGSGAGWFVQDQGGFVLKGKEQGSCSCCSDPCEPGMLQTSQPWFPCGYPHILPRPGKVALCSPLFLRSWEMLSEQ